MVMVLDKSAVQTNLVSLSATVREPNFTLVSKLETLLKQLSNLGRKSVNMLAGLPLVPRVVLISRPRMD